MRPALRLVCLLAAAALMLLAAACGIPLSSHPSELASKGVPSGLLSAGTTTSPTTPSTVPSVETQVSIFLIDALDQVYQVQRYVSVPAPLGAVIEALADGPTPQERFFGLQSEVPSSTKVISTTISGNGTMATINFNNAFAMTAGVSEIQAAAQVVLTTMNLLPKVTGVSFELSGTGIEVPIQGGSEVQVASRADYSTLVPAPATSTTG
jgi:hypothetical protein